MQDTSPDLLTLTATIAAAYFSNHQTMAAQVPDIIQIVHTALAGLGKPADEPLPELKPAVPIKKSITPDFLISLETGKKFKTLRRYLMTSHGMTPDEYRAKWGLPSDYPMVAPNYAAQRSSLAKSSGLGRRAEPEPEPQPVAAPRRRGRKKAEEKKAEE